MYKDPRQGLGGRNNSHTRYPRKYFSQIYRALYGDAMLEVIRMSSYIADGNQQKHLLPIFATYREFTPRGTHKHKSNTFSNTLNCLDSKIPRKKSFF